MRESREPSWTGGADWLRRPLPRPSSDRITWKHETRLLPSVVELSEGCKPPRRPGGGLTDNQIWGEKKILDIEVTTDMTPQNFKDPEMHTGHPTKLVTKVKEMARPQQMVAAGLSRTVAYSNEKHDLHVTLEQSTSLPIAQDLAQVVEEATGIILPF
ncbi:BAG family molecular chaperone regulator 1 [Fukomys damarensis]|uniref:BAG family molecular chaperone regulator 1 n=1 Tax=Fukomys damarensis TaxID=885580 RepID=A0A091E5I6_FUKDA|nr:BAG family molecular chaperone regulator 1 [Fukomys damarensis]